MSIKTETIEFYKDEGGAKNKLLVNFYTKKKIRLVICYINNESSIDKILPLKSSNRLTKIKINFKIYDVINLKTNKTNKNSIIINKNIIEFTPKSAGEYQLSFSILKASRNMDNALFFVKIIDSRNNSIDITSNQIIIKSKRKIAACLRPQLDIPIYKIDSRNKIKFTSNIYKSKIKSNDCKIIRKRTYSQMSHNEFEKKEFKRLKKLVDEYKERLNNKIVECSRLKEILKKRESNEDIEFMLNYPLPISFEDNLYF